MSRRGTASLLGLLVAVGFVLRLLQYDQSLMGDEVSTLWVVRNHSFGGVIDVLRTDAEITPPVSFLLSWLASKLGSDPNLIRLPSLIAGTVSIPLIYLLGKRTVGQAAGLIAAAVFTLSPFMTYFSGNGRGYALLVLLLIGSTMTMLIASESGRSRWWWVAYGAVSCLAMYTHYTAMFVLFGQLLWLLWARPGSRILSLLANGAAALAFLPWLPGLLSDLDSPTQPVLEALQGDGFAAKRFAFEQWGFGHPLIDPSSVPGALVMIVVTTGIAAAVVLSARRIWLRSREAEGRVGVREAAGDGLILVLLIAVATPLGELLLALAGTDLLGSRNMTASWYGLALSLGALITIPGGVAAIVCGTLVLGGYGAASVNLLRDEGKVLDIKGPARVIDSEIEQGDVVVDFNAALTTPTPQIPLEAYLEAGPPAFYPGLPSGDPPFLPTTPIPAANDLLERAFTEAEGHRVLLIAPDAITVNESDGKDPGSAEPVLEGVTLTLPPDARIIEVDSFPGFRTTNLYTIEVG